MKNEDRQIIAGNPPLFIRGLEQLCRHVSYRNLHRIGRVIGILAYYLTPAQRKRVMSNLAIAKSLNLSEKQMKRIAKASFQNLYIVTLDYLKLRQKGAAIDDLVLCENPHIVEHFCQQGQGVILYTGHLSNWEMPFLEESSRMSGMMVAQRFFVASVADWIDCIRRQYGGITVTPDQAVIKGMKALREGRFVGIAGDQALPEGSHYYDFFGSRAWTTVTPAVWAYRSHSPIVTVFTRRENNRYLTVHGEPIWPDRSVPFKSDVRRMMKQVMLQLEQAIRESPEQYLWLHNRWRQDVYDGIKTRFQHDQILIVLPEDIELAGAVCRQLHILQSLYAKAYITVMKPDLLTIDLPLSVSESGLQLDIKSYSSFQELMQRNWSYQMLINFTASKTLGRYYRKLAVREVIHMPVDQSSVDIVASDLEALIRC